MEPATIYCPSIGTSRGDPSSLDGFSARNATRCRRSVLTKAELVALGTGVER
jgi:hypothetical protein